MKIGQHLPKLWTIKYRVVFFNETHAVCLCCLILIICLPGDTQVLYLEYFDTVGWVTGRASGL